MTTTYDENLSTEKDWVRFSIGDRASPYALQDEEITAILAEEPNKWYAAAKCAEAIAGKTRGAVRKQVGRLMIEYSDSAENAYRRLIDDLRAEGARQLMPSTNGRHFVVL